MERFLENAMYASRWLLAPVYFGLSLALIALALKFFRGDYSRTAEYLLDGGIRFDPRVAVAGGYDAGWRFAGDGDVFRLREFRLTTRYL